MACPAVAPMPTHWYVGEKRVEITGYLLYQDSRIAIVATIDSSNPKTANMVQIWFVPRSVKPTIAVRSGADADVCFDCSLRPSADGGCYVITHQAPTAIFFKLERGGYPMLEPADYHRVFAGREVRFGAWGDPVLMEISTIEDIIAIAE